MASDAGLRGLGVVPSQAGDSCVDGGLWAARSRAGCTSHWVQLPRLTLQAQSLSCTSKCDVALAEEAGYACSCGL